jgi:hypothetical protein
MGWELSGYVASGLVLAAFYMKDMIPLRLAALASNLAFIAYGLALGLTPIWLLHVLLVPLNGYRLVEAAKAALENRMAQHAERVAPTAPDSGRASRRLGAIQLPAGLNRSGSCQSF